MDLDPSLSCGWHPPPLLCPLPDPGFGNCLGWRATAGRKTAVLSCLSWTSVLTSAFSACVRKRRTTQGAHIQHHWATESWATVMDPQ